MDLGRGGGMDLGLGSSFGGSALVFLYCSSCTETGSGKGEERGGGGERDFAVGVVRDFFGRGEGGRAGGDNFRGVCVFIGKRGVRGGGVLGILEKGILISKYDLPA